MLRFTAFINAIFRPAPLAGARGAEPNQRRGA